MPRPRAPGGRLAINNVAATPHTGGAGSHGRHASGARGHGRYCRQDSAVHNPSVARRSRPHVLAQQPVRCRRQLRMKCGPNPLIPARSPCACSASCRAPTFTDQHDRAPDSPDGVAQCCPCRCTTAAPPCVQVASRHAHDAGPVVHVSRCSATAACWTTSSSARLRALAAATAAALAADALWRTGFMICAQRRSQSELRCRCLHAAQCRSMCAHGSARVRVTKYLRHAP